MTRQPGMQLNHPNVDERLDRDSQLWKTCAHEGGHYILGIEFGFSVEWPVIFDASNAVVHGGLRTPPKRGMHDLQKRRLLLEDAITDLAGPVISERLEWFPAGCEIDRDHAREKIRTQGFPYLFDEVRAFAREYVAMHWNAISRMADKLYIQNVRRVTLEER